MELKHPLNQEILPSVDKPLETAVASEISIIIPVTGPQEILERCVENLKRHTPEICQTIFVVKDTDTDKEGWLRRHFEKNIHDLRITCSGNADLPTLYNKGIKESGKQIIALLSIETIVTEKWLSGMLECLNSTSDAGIVGAMPYDQNGPPDTTTPLQSVDIEHLNDEARSFRKRYRNRRIPSRTIGGSCILFKRDLLDEIGFLEEGFRTGGSAIEEFCFRAALEGRKNLLAGDVFVHRNKGFEANDIEIQNANKRHDKRLFTQKWGGLDAKTAMGKKVLSLNFLEKAAENHQKGQTDACIDLLLKGIAHCPGNPSLYHMLVETLIDVKQYKDALDVLNRLQPEHQDSRKSELEGYCKMGLELYEEAEKIADRLLLENASSPSALNLKGLLAGTDQEDAGVFFEKAIASDPGYGEPYTHLGTLKWERKEEFEALELFEKGFILSPIFGNTMTVYHTAITSLGLFERAEPIFREAHRLYPTNKRLKFLLIDILIRQKKHDAAMKEIKSAMIDFTVDDGFLSAALKVRDFLEPKKSVESSRQKDTVSLCMIVKNEAEYLAKCLKSVESVVDEMIVVDTGSTDSTKQIAEIFGAKVYDFKWTDDFSEARNFSISLAKGDWIFLLDADEVISPLDFDLFRSIIQDPLTEPIAYSLVTRNYIPRANTIGWIPNDGKYAREEASKGWIPSYKVRLFPNDNRIRFEYPVHEMVEPSLARAGIKMKNCSIPIHHYGKLNTEKSDCKGEIYYLIGRKKLEEAGDSAIAIRELAIQAGLLKKWEEAIELWQRLLAIRPETPEAFVNMGTAHWQLGEYDNALFAARKAMALAPHMNESFYNYSICQLHLGNAKEAISTLEALLERAPEYLPAQFMFAAAYCCAGEKEKGIQRLEKLRKANTGSYIAISCHELANGFVSAKNIEYAVLLLNAAIETGNINKDVLRLFSKCLELRKSTG